MKGKLIGEGNTAEVYTWGDNEILKLFRKEFPFEDAEKEYQINRAIGNQGLPVPRALNLVEMEDRKGIIYQKASGVNMFELMIRKPLSCTKYAKLLAELHYQIHQCFGLNIPKYKDTLEWNIRHTDALSEEQKIAVLNLLEQLPEGISLCHGDFHPGNIIGEDENYYILDWMNATVGAPEADVARTLLLLRDAVMPEYFPFVVKLLFGLFRKSMAKTYVKRYMALSGVQKDEINRWRIVIAAARLMEWIPKAEKTALLKEIDRATGEAL